MKSVNFSDILETAKYYVDCPECKLITNVLNSELKNLEAHCNN